MLAVGVGLTDLPVLGGGSNRPTFAVNFANGESAVSKYGFTFTRSGAVATYVDSAGLIATATADVPRYTYDPVTLAPLGILIEESRTNLVPISTAWTATGGGVVEGIQSAPDGTTTAIKLSEGSGTNSWRCGINVNSLTSGTTYTLSALIKPGTATRVQVTGQGSTFGTSQYANFSLVGAGSVLASAGCTATVSVVANGWYRCAIAVAATATETSTISVSHINSDTATRLPSYAGNTALNVYVFGGQVEAGSFPTSYIPTTSAAVTRGADTYSFTGAAGRTNLIVGSAAPATQNVTTTATAYTLSHTGTGTITLSGTSTAGPLVGAGSLTFTPSAGTLTLTMSGTVTNAQLETGSSATAYIATTNGPRTVENVASWFNVDNFTVVVFAVPGVPNGTTKLCGLIGDSAYTGSSRLYVRLDGGTGNVSITSGTLTSTGSLGSVTNSSAHKFAYTYSMSAAQTAGCMDGGSVATANQTTTLYKETSMAPGGYAGVNYLNGTLAYIAYYPTRLSNATLQALTT